MLAIFGRSEKQIDKRKQIMIICGAIRFDFERRVGGSIFASAPVCICIQKNLSEENPDTRIFSKSFSRKRTSKNASHFLKAEQNDEKAEVV